MTEILNDNFNEFYPRLKKLINNASFIAIDTELSGISTNIDMRHSLFESLNDRYKKQREVVKNFIIIQFGIAVFKRCGDSNLYNAECFNFYLLPRPLPINNRQITFQVGALEFLSKHNFDFNTLVNQGISYLNEAEEKSFRSYIKDNDFITKLKHLSLDDEQLYDANMTEAYEWFFTESSNTLNLNVSAPIVQYFIQKSLRDKIEHVWTTATNETITVTKVDSDAEKTEGHSLEEELLDSYLGFSKIFKLLSSSKKPIIGHNMLYDLMFMHHQFYKSLPNKYTEFKSNIHSLFPQVYDTKFLCTELKKECSGEVNWTHSSLNSIYEFFLSKQGRYLAVNSPTVKLLNATSDKPVYHNAAWDAFFAGYIFIKMGHVLSVKKYGSGLEERAITHTELMSSVKKYVNSLNVSRSSEICMKLDGKDPIYATPQWLHVKLKSPSIDAKELLKKLSTYGQVDIIPFARKRVLVAVSSKQSALNILKQFQSSKEFQVARYNRIRHATPGTICLWSGIILSGATVVWALKETFTNFLRST